MLGAFLIECTARNLAVSAERVGAGMDRLRQAQDRLRSAFRESDFLLEAPDGAEPEDEMEAAAAAASGIHREVNRIADVARRLASFEGLPNGRAVHALVDVNACIEEAIAATGAEDAATVAVKLGAMPEIFAATPEVRLMIGEILENSIHAVEGLEGRPPPSRSTLRARTTTFSSPSSTTASEWMRIGARRSSSPSTRRATGRWGSGWPSRTTLPRSTKGPSRSTRCPAKGR